MNRFPFRPGTALALGVLVLFGILGAVLLNNMIGDGVVIGGDDPDWIDEGDAGLLLGDSAEGRGLFEERCAGCHGTAGGGTVAGPTLLADWLAESAFSDDDMAGIIKGGMGPMPPFRWLDAQEMADVVAYVRELQQLAGLW